MQRGKVWSAERQSLDVVQSVNVRSYRAECKHQKVYGIVVDSVMWIGRVYTASWQIPSCRVAESADGMVEAILSLHRMPCRMQSLRALCSGASTSLHYRFCQSAA